MTVELPIWAALTSSSQITVYHPNLRAAGEGSPNRKFQGCANLTNCPFRGLLVIAVSAATSNSVYVAQATLCRNILLVMDYVNLDTPEDTS